MIHLTLQQLSAFLDGELTDASTELIRRHLSECDACTLRFGRVEAQEEVLVRILVDEPSDAFFADLAASIAAQCGGGKSGSSAGRGDKKKPKVEERKVAAAPRPSAPKPAPAEPKPTPVAPKPATAEPKPVPVAQALPPAKPVVATTPTPEPKPTPAPAARSTSTPFPVPAARPAKTQPATPNPETRPILYGRRAEDVKPGAGLAPAAWIAAAVILVIVASAAWVGLHRGSAPATGTPAVSEGSPAPSEPTPQPSTAPGNPDAPVSLAPAEPMIESAAPVASEPEITSDSAPRVAPETTPERAPDVALEETTITPPEPPPAAPAKPKAQPKKTAAAKSPTPTSAPAPTPERLVTRPPQNFVPVRTFITETVMSPTGPNAQQPPAAAPPSQPTAPSSTRLIQEAKSASLRAAKVKSPATFDEAASAWERAMPAVGNSPEDLAMARRELAQARFQAWAESPTPARREAAVTAARAYLLYAPPGPERDQAWTWLGRLKH